MTRFELAVVCFVIGLLVGWVIASIRWTHEDDDLPHFIPPEDRHYDD